MITPDHLLDFVQENRYVVAVDGPGGSIIAIAPMMFNDRITLCDRLSIHEGWCYDKHGAALDALEAWAKIGFTDEPIGWKKHVPSGRRGQLADEAVA